MNFSFSFFMRRIVATIRKHPVIQNRKRNQSTEQDESST